MKPVLRFATGWANNRTAWVLLASAGLCLALARAHVPFNPVIWMLIDLAVILLIVRPKMTYPDCVILALFAPAWVFYLLPDAARYGGSLVVVVVQFLLTAPLHRLAFLPAKARRWLSADDAFDRLVAHVRLAGA